MKSGPPARHALQMQSPLNPPARYQPHPLLASRVFTAPFFSPALPVITFNCYHNTQYSAGVESMQENGKSEERKDKYRTVIRIRKISNKYLQTGNMRSKEYNNLSQRHED